MAKFPATANLEGFMAPARYEVDLADLDIDGTVPEDIDGAFYRVNPDPQFPAKMGDDIWFNGDGMVSQFRFHGGKVDFKHRWVRTDKWLLENEAGEALFGHYRNPIDDDASVKGKIRGTANTNAIVHGHTLWALKEDSPAIAMDPITLETRGYWDFGGQVKAQTLSAHPKLDPVTGNMCTFSYAAKGLLSRDVAYYEIDKAGKVVREAWFEAPYYCMMHDFGVTEDYAIFHVVPIVSSPERLAARLPHFGWDTTLPVYLGILPRDGTGKDVRWFETGNCFASHVWNAFNEGTKIHFDVPESKGTMFPFFPDVHGAPFNPKAAEGRMTRWTVDMASNGNGFEKKEQLCDFVGEFPRIDDRYATQPYRHGFQLVADDSQPAEFGREGLFMNTLGHVDLATGKTKSWWCGPVSSLQEPCFIPRSKDAPEGEGYIVGLCNRLKEMRSDLLLFDAQHIDEGPIATIKMPLRVRPGLHGNWHDADQISELPVAA